MLYIITICKKNNTFSCRVKTTSPSSRSSVKSSSSSSVISSLSFLERLNFEGINFELRFYKVSRPSNKNGRKYATLNCKYKNLLKKKAPSKDSDTEMIFLLISLCFLKGTSFPCKDKK